MSTYDEDLDELLLSLKEEDVLSLEKGNAVPGYKAMYDPNNPPPPLEEEELDTLIAELETEVAQGPMTFDQYVKDKELLDSRSTGEKVLAFGESALIGGKALVKEGMGAIDEVFSGDVGLDELGGAYDVGIADFKRFGKTISGAAMDMISGTDEENLKNEYKRYRENFDYYNEVRPKMIEASTEDGEQFVSFGANFVDPTMLVPLAGPAAKVGSITLKSARLGKLAKAVDKVGEVASLPAKGGAVVGRLAVKGSAKGLEKVAGVVGRVGEKTQDMAGKAATAGAVIGSYGGPTGALAGAFTAASAAKIAKVTGQGMERTLSALSSSAGQKRFLQRLAVTAESPTVRQAALIAHKMGGTKLGDAMFNSVVNGATAGSLNSALAFVSGGGVEEAGQAFGQGYVSGGIGIFNQPGTKAGKSIKARDETSVSNFMQAKLVDNQLKAFKRLTPEARLAFASLEEAGVPSPNLVFLNRQNYLEMVKSKYPDAESVPNAEYNPNERTIFVNQDGDMKKGSREAMQIVTEELGHHFITEAIKDDPLFAHQILEQYRAKPGEDGVDFIFTSDSFGKPIDKIRINKEGQKLAEAYDSLFGDDATSMGIQRDANRLAQEIGGTHFSLMMSDNPKVFNNIDPAIIQKLTDAGEKVLSLFGGADPYTGNVFKKGMAPLVKKSKPIENLYKNYLSALEKKQVQRAAEVEGKGVVLPKGTTADRAFKEQTGSDGITLQEAAAFVVPEKSGKDALKQELKIREEGGDPNLDPELALDSVKADNELKLARRNRNKAKKESEADPTDSAKKQAADQAEQATKQAQVKADQAKSKAKKSGKGMIFERSMLVGKNLPDQILNIFTDNGRKDRNGRIKGEVDKITDAINNAKEMMVYYRSAKPSVRGDREVHQRFFTPLQFRVSKIKSGNPQLQIDVIDERYLKMNLDAMVKSELITDPDGLMERARMVAKNALQDPEGRINPEGLFENEEVTALFGLKESAANIRDPKLRQFLENRKDSHAIRTFDLFRAAGLKETGQDGISFDWNNVKSNYAPFQGVQVKGSTKASKAQPANRIQQQAPAMPGNRFMAPAASAGAKLSERFR